MANPKHKNTLSSLLNHDWLLENAGQKVFDRGVDYHARNLAEIINRSDDEVVADVEGTETYRVRIRARDNGLSASCDCPAMEDFGGICKHIVATALTVMEDRATPARQGGPAKRPPTRQEQIETWLNGLAREDLTALVREYALENKNFRRVLLRRAAAASLPDRPEALLKSFRAQITQVTATRGFVDYWAAAGWFAPVTEVINDIEKQVLPRQPAVAAELCEHLYERLEKSIGNIDDSNGECSSALDELGPLYRRACEAAKLKPELLAEKLFAQRRDNWLFWIRIEDFRPILGKTGWEHYKKLVKDAYASLPEEKPKIKRHGMIAVYTGTQEDSRATSIRSMMKEILETDGSIDERIAFMGRDLSWPNQYINIAELCLSDGREDEAGQWLDKGLAAFKPPFAQNLPWRRAGLYIKRQEYQKAQDLLWRSFEQRGDYNAWKDMSALWLTIPDDARRSAPQALEDRAIAWLKKGIKGEDGYRRRDALARIYLDRSAPEDAWAVTKAGSMAKELMLKIAKEIKAKNPDAAIGIYRSFTEECVVQTGRSFYEEAVKYLKALQGLMDRDDFSAYVADIRARFPRKRTLIEMLQKF